MRAVHSLFGPTEGTFAADPPHIAGFDVLPCGATQCQGGTAVRCGASRRVSRRTSESASASGYNRIGPTASVLTVAPSHFARRDGMGRARNRKCCRDPIQCDLELSCCSE